MVQLVSSSLIECGGEKVVFVQGTVLETCSQAELDRLDNEKADKSAMEERIVHVDAALSKLNEDKVDRPVYEAHVGEVSAEFINVNNMVAEQAETAAARAATVDEALSTKLEKDALDEVKAEIKRLDEIKADKDALERVKAEFVTNNQTIAANAMTVIVQFEEVYLAAAARNIEVDEVLSTKLEEDSLTAMQAELVRLDRVKAEKSELDEREGTALTFREFRVGRYAFDLGSTQIIEHEVEEGAQLFRDLASIRQVEAWIPLVLLTQEQRDVFQQEIKDLRANSSMFWSSTRTLMKENAVINVLGTIQRRATEQHTENARQRRAM